VAKAASAPSPKLEGFAVQVGAFRDEDKLAQAREKLAFAGISHYVERRGDLNRLRAGPYNTREAAEKALASVKAASLDGQVVPLP
jgi:DedD protein